MGCLGFRALFLGVVALATSGCLTLNNPITTVRVGGTAAGGAGGSGGGGGSSCPTTIVSAVSALYPANGANWMDHVQTAATGTACDGTNLTGGFETCIHGGERRRVDLPGIADCTGVTASDNLAAFDWLCNDNGGSDAYVYSVSLKKGKGLANLLNGTGTAFLSNYVTVSRSGCTIVETAPAVWWTNNISVLTDNATDQVAVDVTGANSGTIYTVPADTTIDGFFIGGNKIAVVTLGSAALRFSGMGFDNNADGLLENNGNCLFNGTSSVASNSSCLISVAGADFIWIEGRFRGDADTNYVATYNPQTPTDANRVIYITGTSTYNTFRNVTVNGGALTNEVLIVGGGSTPNMANSRFYNIKTFGGTQPNLSGLGLQLSSTQYNILEKVIVANTRGDAAHNYVNSHLRYINVKVYGGIGGGFKIDGNNGIPTWTEESTFVNFITTANTVGSDKPNFHFRTARRNTLLGITHGNHSDGSVWGGSLYFWGGGGTNHPTNNTVVSSLGLNINKSVIYSEESTNTHINTVAGSNFGAGVNDKFIRLEAGSAGFTLSGRVWYGNQAGGGTACTVAGNITTSGCQYGGATNPLSTTLDLVADVFGDTTDGINIFGGTGNVTYASLNANRLGGLTDWVSFSNFNHFIGLYGGTAGLAAEDQGLCGVTTTCQIYSFELSGAATLKNINGTFTAGAACPASVDASVAANVVTDQLTAPNTFLINAREVIDDYDSNGDRLGDDDGLCESYEACIFTPDIGASNLLEPNTSAGTCTFTGGNGVVGVTMYSGMAQ
jgi:hypothetical protein